MSAALCPICFLVPLIFGQDQVRSQEALAPPQSAEEFLSRVMSAKGRFDEAALCANVEQKCTVVSNSILLTYGIDEGKVTGRSASTVQYRPYPKCRPWLLNTAFAEFTGEVINDAELHGRATGQMYLIAEMYNPKRDKCRPLNRSFGLKATWQASIDGDRAKGVLTVPGAEGENTVSFTLEIKTAAERLKECSSNEPHCTFLRQIERRDSEELATAGPRG